MYIRYNHSDRSLLLTCALATCRDCVGAGGFQWRRAGGEGVVAVGWLNDVHVLHDVRPSGVQLEHSGFLAKSTCTSLNIIRSLYSDGGRLIHTDAIEISYRYRYALNVCIT